jgi:hypothetical protein
MGRLAMENKVITPSEINTIQTALRVALLEQLMTSIIEILDEATGSSHPLAAIFKEYAAAVDQAEKAYPHTYDGASNDE